MVATAEISRDREALLLAIAIERHNSRLFREWAMRFRPYDAAVSIFLEELALEELAHEQDLLDIYRKYFGNNVPPAVPFPDELLYFTKGLDAIKDHFFVISSCVAQSLLEMAIKIERYTQQFYLNLLAKTTDPELSAIYRTLGEFENGHENILLERLEAEQITSSEECMVSEKYASGEVQWDES